MILSVSRRTDIPNYWADWFLRRLEEGYVCIRNPINAHQISRVALSPETVDCIVFWSKNPAALARRLDELEGYPYYFQYTITAYGKDVEPGLPDKKEVLIPLFQDLSRRLGPRRMVWRYDPILFSRRYTPEYHLRAFEEMARMLEGYAQRVVISFVDLYAKTRRSTAGLELSPPPGDGALLDFAGSPASASGPPRTRTSGRSAAALRALTSAPTTPAGTAAAIATPPSTRSWWSGRRRALTGTRRCCAGPWGRRMW